MAFAPASTNPRVASALAAALVQAALLYVLIAGLAVKVPALVRDAGLAVFETTPPPPAPKPTPPPPPLETKSRPEGAAAPPNLRSTPTEIVAPPPVLPLPSPVIAAPIAASGNQPSAGAAPLPGPGTGAGGVGNGTGSGGAGNGTGSGGNGAGDGAPPRRTKGRISDADYPAEAGLAPGSEGVVGVRYKVEIDGHASNCTVTESSGSDVLDATTCRLIEQRFRFRPARDDAGKPVRSTIVERHIWVNPAPPPPER